MRKLAAIAAFSAALLAGAAAAAQERDPTGAEALFWEGRRAFDAGQYEVACARFEESQRLDPSVGTLFNLAVCEEARGRIAQAWQHFAQAEGQLPADDQRRTYAAERVAALAARLPRLTITLPGGAPAGLAVSRDGIVVAAGGFGVPLPTPPGRHEIVVSAPGRPDRKIEVVLAEAESKTVIAEPNAVASAPAPWTPPPGEATTPRRSPWRTVGWVSLGVGAAGLALGAVAGLLAIDAEAKIQDDCDPGAGGRLKCGSDGLDAASSGKTWATTSTVAFVAGAAAAAGGVTLVIATNPGTSSSVGPSVRLGVGRKF